MSTLDKRLTDAWAYQCGISPTDERALEADKVGWPEKFEYFRSGWEAALSPSERVWRESEKGAQPCCGEYTTCHKPCTTRGAYLERAGVYRNETFTVQRAPTQAGERATLAADQVQANAPESDALPERRTRQVAYPGIDKRKVRGETPRTDAASVSMERLDGDVDEVVPADFARTLELEADFYKLAATMQRENQEHAEAELNKALRELAEANTRLENNFAFNTDGERIACKPGEIPDGIECRDATIAGQDNIIEELRAKLSDAKTVVAGLAQVSEMAHKENAKLEREWSELMREKMEWAKERDAQDARLATLSAERDRVVATHKGLMQAVEKERDDLKHELDFGDRNWETLVQRAEKAEAQLVEAKRRLDEALDVIERHEAEKKADVLAEREACARVCDSRSDEHWKSYKTIGPFRGDSRAETWGDEAEECAKAIRARTGGKP